MLIIFFLFPGFTQQHNITEFTHSHGRFVNAGNKTWHEYNQRNKHIFTFKEVSFEDGHVLIHDAKRDLSIKLPIEKGWCIWKRGNADWASLYFITKVSSNPAKTQ